MMTTDLEPTQAELDRFIVGAGFTRGWENVESAARHMARHAVRENRHLAQSVEQAKTVLEALAEPNEALLDAFQRGFTQELRKKKRTTTAEKAGIKAMLVELLKQLEK